MKKYHISKLFNQEGLILENNNSLKISEINIDEIKLFFEKYGIIVFKGFDFEPKKLTENVYTLVDDLIKAKPSTTKGKYMKNITLSSTMGPGIKVDLSTVERSS